jgi:nitrile hydratase
MNKASEAAVPARFQTGDRVKVRRAFPPGHLRTPFYVRGHVGTVERLCGAFPNPEELCFFRPGLPAQPLYRVRFEQAKLWPDYSGPRRDHIEIEIYQHWLEPA